MAVKDDIEAAYARQDLNAAERRKLAYRIAGQAWFNDWQAWIANNLPYTHTMSGGRVVTVRKIKFDEETGVFKIYATYVKNGVTIWSDRVFRIVKPPIMVPHPSGTPREDVRAAAVAWLEATFK